MANYVFQGDTCTCPFAFPPGSKGIFTESRPVNKDGARAMQVITDMPDMPHLCTSPMNPAFASTGVPQPCSAPATLIPPWVCANLTLTCCGTLALLTGSTLSCAYAPNMIVVDQKPDNPNNYNSAILPLPETAVAPVIPETVEREKISHEQGETNEDSVTKQKREMGYTVSSQSTQKAQNTENTEEDVQTQQSAAEPESLTPEQMHEKELCSGKCPMQYRDSCPFRQKAALTEPNPKKKTSDGLTREMCNHDGVAYQAALQVIESEYYEKNGIQIHFSAERHHLIPGDCYAKNTRLMQLGNAYGYDINSWQNLILLPTLKTNVEQRSQVGGFSDYDRLQAQYQIMERDVSERLPRQYRYMIGSQIHSGGHSLKDKDKKMMESGQLTGDFANRVRKKIEERRRKKGSYEAPPMEYTKQVEAKMRNLEYSLDAINNLPETCRMEHFEEEQKQFLEKMHLLSSEIRENVKAVPRNTFHSIKDSDRMYTSFVAMAFDNGIPVDEFAEATGKGGDRK